MWGAIFVDVFAVAFTVGCIWVSVAKGHLVYRGTQHITRADNPAEFWGWIAFNCVWLAFAFWLTFPAIQAGL